MRTVIDAAGVDIRAERGFTRVNVHSHARKTDIRAAAFESSGGPFICATLEIGASLDALDPSMSSDVSLYLSRDDAATLVASITAALAAEEK